MKQLMLLLALFFLASCAGVSLPTPTAPEEVEVPTEVAKPEVAPTLPAEYGVTFTPVEQYSTPAQRVLIKAGVAKLYETVQTQCFKDFMLSAKLNSTNGRSNQEVYDHIMGLKGDVPVKMYYRKWGCKIGCTSAVAFRQPPQKTINLNSAFFTSKVSACRWGATIAHESLGHSMGNYGHTSKWTEFREYTVPYKLGGGKPEHGNNAFSVCCKE